MVIASPANLSSKLAVNESLVAWCEVKIKWFDTDLPLRWPRSAGCPRQPRLCSRSVKLRGFTSKSPCATARLVIFKDSSVTSANSAPQ